MGAQLPGPLPRLARSAQVSMPEGIKGRMERADARSAAVPGWAAHLAHWLPLELRDSLNMPPAIKGVRKPGFDD
jgi:hypothetical protein